MAPHRFRVLIAEDDPVARRLLMCAVQASGVPADVRVAEDGDVALGLLREAAGAEEWFDLLLTDNQMPGVQGTELILLAQVDSPGTARAMVTSDLHASIRQRAGLESLQLFDKPVPVPDVAAFVRQVADATGPA